MTPQAVEAPDLVIDRLSPRFESTDYPGKSIYCPPDLRFISMNWGWIWLQRLNTFEAATMEAKSPSSTVGHQGRVAIVTGAARGLGRAIAQGLAGAGAAVVGVDLLDLEETGELVSGSGADWLAIQTDMSSEAQIDVIANQVHSRFGRCDILINCAGVGESKTWDELDFSEWRRILSINLDSQFLMCKAIVPLMKQHSYGRIVNIVSSTVKATMSTMIAYRVSKMGLIGLTRGLASLGDAGITANAVTPSLTKTGITAEVGVPEERYAVFTQGQSIKRIATPEDLVPTVLFLSSAESYWVTGQAFSADGGASFGLP